MKRKKIYYSIESSRNIFTFNWFRLLAMDCSMDRIKSQTYAWLWLCAHSFYYCCQRRRRWQVVQLKYGYGFSDWMEHRIVKQWKWTFWLIKLNSFIDIYEYLLSFIFAFNAFKIWQRKVVSDSVFHSNVEHTKTFYEFPFNHLNCFLDCFKYKCDVH